MTVAQVSDIVRVTAKFQLINDSGPNEIAEMSTCWHSDTNPSSDGDWAATLLEMATKYEASYIDRVATEHYNASVALVAVRAAHESTSGHTLHEQIKPYVPGENWFGTGTPKSLPWQLSLCISLYAHTPGVFDPIGRVKRGRYYLPPYCTSILDDVSNGEPTLTFVTDRANEQGLVLKDVQTHTFTSLSAFHPILGVNSRGGVRPITIAPAFYPVTFLKVDNRLDTQRRRVNKLAPDHAQAPYPG